MVGTRAIFLLSSLSSCMTSQARLCAWFDCLRKERQRFSVSHLLSIAWKMLIELLGGRPREGLDLFPLSNIKDTGVLCNYNDCKSRRLGCYYLCMWKHTRNDTTKSTSYVVSRVTLLGFALGLFLQIIIIIIIIIKCKDNSASVRTNCATEHERGCTLQFSSQHILLL